MKAIAITVFQLAVSNNTKTICSYFQVYLPPGVDKYYLPISRKTTSYNSIKEHKEPRLIGSKSE
jgi:hypothetical protein